MKYLPQVCLLLCFEIFAPDENNGTILFRFLMKTIRPIHRINIPLHLKKKKTLMPTDVSKFTYLTRAMVNIARR
jgi:hypothetical protein